eukprot:gene25025-31434_t
MSSLEFAELESSLMDIEDEKSKSLSPLQTKLESAPDDAGQSDYPPLTQDSFGWDDAESVGSRVSEADESEDLSPRLSQVSTFSDTPCKKRVSKTLFARLNPTNSRQTRRSSRGTSDTPFKTAIVDVTAFNSPSPPMTTKLTPKKRPVQTSPEVEVEDVFEGDDNVLAVNHSAPHSPLSVDVIQNDDLMPLAGMEANDFMAPADYKRTPRSVRKPISYQEPSLSVKVRKGFKFFKYDT